MVDANASSRWVARLARKGEIWCALLAVSLGLSLADAIDIGSSQVARTALAHDRAIRSEPSLVGEAVGGGLSGVVSTLGFAIGAILFFLALSLFNRWLDRRHQKAATERESVAILLLSQLSLALYMLALAAPGLVSPGLRIGIHLLSLVLLLTMVAKAVAFESRTRNRTLEVAWQILSDDQLTVAALCVVPPLIIVGGLVGGCFNPLAGRSVSVVFLVFLGVLAVVGAVYLALARRIVGEGGPGSALRLYDFDTATTVAAAPLLLVPVACQLANEIQVSFQQLAPAAIALGLVALLLACSGLLFWLRWTGRLHLSSAKALSTIYFPAALVSLVSLATHRQTLELGRLDYVQIGASALPAQQLADFGRWPFLDLVPAHGLAEAGFATLYAWLHGANGLDMLVWQAWLPGVVGYLAIYLFLSRAIAPLIAFLVTVLLPVEAVVGGATASALLTAALMVEALRRPALGRFLVLWSMLGCLWLWRPGLGLAATVSTLFVVGAVLVCEERQSLGRAAGALALALLAVPVGLLLTELGVLGGGGGTLQALIADAGRPPESVLGAVALAPGLGTVVGFLVAALPIVAVGIVLLYLLQLVVRKQSSAGPTRAVLWVAVFVLVAPASARIGSTEVVFTPSLGLLLLALLPMAAAPARVGARMLGRTSWLMLALVGAVLLTVPERFPLLDAKRSFAFHRWQEAERRVRFAAEPHRDLVELLERNLEDDAMFLDFSGSPALYALAGRRYPLDQIADFGDTSEALQSRQLATLERALDRGQLPLVVFSAPWAAELAGDGLPRAVVSYRISELIYRNFVPWVTVDGWQVWRQRGRRPGRPTSAAAPSSAQGVSQHFDLGAFPGEWARHDPWRSVERNEVVATLSSGSLVVRPGVPVSLRWGETVDPAGGSYLHLRARAVATAAAGEHGSAAQLTISYGEPVESSLRFLVSGMGPLTDFVGEPLAVPLRSDARTQRAARLPNESGGLLFRAGDRDPAIRRWANLAGVPAIPAREELWIRLAYRSTLAGSAQIFFAVDGGGFSEATSMRFEMVRTVDEAAPATLALPVMGGEPGQRLTDLRLDPPAGAELEIVGLDLLQRSRRYNDYMIRVSTQWRWFQGDVRELELRADRPVIVERVALLGGD